MSAIAGIYNLNQEPICNNHLSSMMENLQKYPANDVQIFKKENIFLGCHAQWITPESIGEQLPFYDSERKAVITADAIIDNRDELYELLQVDREERKTIPDSQLILKAYYKWGEDSPRYLIGDFAFMIWDEKKQKLFGARDFSGGRTLYYYNNLQKFAFCTTITPLLELPFIKKTLNEYWLAEYLAISAVVDTVDTSITPYLGIEQLPPSHSITIMGNKKSIKRYFTLTSDKQLILRSNDEYIEAFRDVFQKAVISKLRTYLPVGAHLSGGLDSSSVVSFAAKVLKKQNKSLETFSYVPVKDFIDYTAKRYLSNETPFIQSTAKFLGKGVTANLLDFDGKDPYTGIDEYLNLLEMPYKYFENSFWIKGIFEKAHEKGIGVLLNGGRGNFTISWGHALNYYAVLLRKMKWIKLVRELDQYCKKAGGARLRRLPVIARVAYPTLNRLLSKQIQSPLPQLINHEFASRTNVYNKLNCFGINETGWLAENDNIYDLRKRHFEDIFHWNSTNTMATKLSLPYSLWKRDTTNDIRVIQFCLSLPEEQYVQNGLDRALIRRATEGYLPDEVRLNQQVRGVQGADWLHRMLPYWNEFLEEIETLTMNPLIKNYVNIEVIKCAFIKIKGGVGPEQATDPEIRILMRSLVLNRFLNKFN